MTLYYIQFNADRNNTWTSSLVDLADEKYTFSIRWNDYCNCFFMDIQDLDGNYLMSGLALANNLSIRHQKLPYKMLFTHIDGKIYEPTIDNITEFGLFYDDGEE